MTKSSETSNEAPEDAVKHIAPSPIKRSWVISGVVILVLVAGSTFLLGMAVGAGQHRNGSNVANANGFPSKQYGPAGGRGGFRMGTRGTVTAISSTSITIQASDGTSKTYTINSNTTVRDMGSQSASLSDIANGMTVAIRTSSSASTVASAIIIFDASANSSTAPMSGSAQSY